MVFLFLFFEKKFDGFWLGKYDVISNSKSK